MSYPINPLSKYRTYSYHHVLAVCDSTQTAIELSDSGVLMEYFLNRSPDDKLKSHTTSDGGKYVLLISGFTDAQFVIQDVKWTTIVASDIPTQDSGPLVSTVEVDGEISILEPYGVRFMNVLSNVCDTLETDPVGLVFVLKTFFVGHTDTGEQDTITNIRPFMFIAWDIQAKFDETGALYTMGFVGLSNGVGKMPYANEIATFVTIAPNANQYKGQTLAHVFEDFLPDVIAKEYQSNKNRLEEDFSKAKMNTNFETQFRPVKYKFNLDPQYRGYTFGTNESTYIENEPNSPILAFSSSPTVEMIIEKVMMSSKEVVAECNNSTDKFIFKITSSLESTPEEYMVVYHIHRYKCVTEVVTDAGEPFQPEPGNYIEFDYTFSGKNIDIKDFDIKMQLGLAFFQTLASTKNIAEQTEQISTIQKDSNGPGGPITGSIAKSSNASPIVRNKTPLFLGGQAKGSLYRNKMYSVDTNNFRTMLARHAAYENISCKMIIAGNPQLLDEFSALPADFARRETETPKEGQTIAPRWMSIPAYTKVNIYMPTNDPSRDFAERFWYDGYYQILAIDNIFSGGEFVQELDMISLPMGSDLDTRSDDQFTEEDAITVPPEGNSESRQTISSLNQSVEERMRILQATSRGSR